MVYWEATNGKTATASYRRAANVSGAVRSARCYWRDKLQGEGVILYHASPGDGNRPVPGSCFRRDENSAMTGHKWVVRTLPASGGNEHDRA